MFDNTIEYLNNLELTELNYELISPHTQILVNYLRVHSSGGARMR